MKNAVSGNFYLSIDAVAARRGSAPCWIVPQRGRWSFDDLRSGCTAYAAVLRKLGLQPGDRVLAQLEKSPEALLLYLACLRAGAVYVPLNTAYTPTEIEYFVSDARPRVLVCDPSRAAVLAATAEQAGVSRLLTLDAAGGGQLPQLAREIPAASAHADRDIAACTADDLAAILYTSGTTGRSKGAMLTHGNLESNARSLVALWEFTDADVLLHALPVYHIHGLFVASHCALLSGAASLLLPKFEMEPVLDLLPQATVFMGVPTYYVRLLADQRLNREVGGALRLFVCGSAPLLPNTFEQFAERTGHRILERYGMSEAGMIASNPYRGERCPGTVGFPLPGVEVRVANEDGVEQTRGTAGVLEIRGPNLFRGYWCPRGKTAQDFRGDGFFVTGDIATQDESGRIAIVGRARDLIISGGFNVYPKEIELEIDALPGVLESAVIGVPHPDFGEAVIAVVCASDPTQISEAGVIDGLSGRLARFKQPKRVFLIAELPRNPMGKVQKNLLRERFRDSFA